MSIKLVVPSNHFILCRPLFLLPSIFPSIRVFSSESALHIRWPKYWSFSFSISSSNVYSGLIFLRMDLLDLLAVQGTLKSLLQYHSSKASIFRYSAFFMIQLSHLYMTTGKKHTFDWTDLCQQRSLLFNVPSTFVIAFLDVYPLAILSLGSLHNRGNKNSYLMTLVLIHGCPQHLYLAGVPARGPSSLRDSDVMVRGGV